jgi:nitroreductase
MPKTSQYVPYDYEKITAKEMLENSDSFFKKMDKRRTIRHFSDEEIPIEVIENLVKTASTAPSGAHKQPWTYCIVSNPELKSKIRKAAEKEEFENYNGRMSEEWLNDLAVFETNWEKPFLEIAPYLIVIFKQTYGMNGDQKTKHYYVNESVGISVGLFIAAAHQAGLATLTHTPSPLNFLTQLLNRPINEKPFLLIPIGYPAVGASVPRIERKQLEDFVVSYK